MLEHEGDGFRVQAGVEGVEHGPGHGHAEVGLEHGGHIGQHGRHGIARLHAAADQGRGQPPAAGVGLGPGDGPVAMDDGRLARKDHGGALHEGQRRQRDMVGLVLV